MDLREALKEKVYNAFAEQQYIGRTYYSDDEYQELLAYTSNYAQSCAYGWDYSLKGDEKIHFATLVEIAKHWKNDDDNDNGFWLYVFKKLFGGGDYPKLYKELTDLIRGFKYRKILPVTDYSSKKYYATIMMHAFAPVNSINSFLDFVYNIYKKDLDFNYTTSDKEICEIATNGFCDVAEKLGGKNEDVSIGSGVYGIKIGLRCMALGKDTRPDFIDLINLALSTIESLKHGNKLSDDDYFIKLISNWWEEKSDRDTASSATKQDPPTKKQNITTRFVYQNGDIYLRIPPIRFASGENPKLLLSIFVGNDTPISQEVFTRIGEITVTSVQQDILLNQVLPNGSPIDIRVELCDNGKPIFNKRLKREFILFDSEKETSNRILKATNYFVYATRTRELQLPVAFNSIGKNLYNIYPTDGECICGKDTQVVFVDDIESTSSLNKVRLTGCSNICQWVYEEQNYSVFSNKIGLLVPTNMSVNGLEIKVGEVKFLLSDIDSTQSGSYYLYDITDKISLYQPTEIAVYSYLKEKEILHENIILIKNLRVEFSESIYYGADKKSVRINVDSKYKDVTWTLGDEQAVCPICHGRMLLDIPLLKWRIDVGEWHYGSMRGILWYKNYFNNGSVLEIQSPYDMRTIRLYCICDGNMQEIPLNTSLKFEIGRYVYLNEGRKNLMFFLTVSSLNKRFEICKTTTVSRFLQNPPFEIVDGKMRFTGEQTYVGERVSEFTILLQCIGKDDVKIKSTELSNGILKGVEENNYWIKITSPATGLFKKEEKVLWEGEYIFGESESNALKNKVLKIKPICGVGNGDYWKVSKSGYYISELVRETQNINNGIYFGSLYYQSVNGERTSVCGFSECRIEIISTIALKVAVKDNKGEYTLLFKCNHSGDLFEPQLQTSYTAHNYHFIEVNNV